MVFLANSLAFLGLGHLNCSVEIKVALPSLGWPERKGHMGKRLRRVPGIEQRVTEVSYFINYVDGHRHLLYHQQHHYDQDHVS